jgi:hypothetical protein
MKYIFYSETRAPIEVTPIALDPRGFAVLRPPPRIGERVVLDGAYFDVTDVVHPMHVPEVRIFVREITH